MPGNTTNFGFEYPLSTDNLSDGAQSIQDFATLADTTFVDLKGGTTGQYLAKNTNTDMDFVWSNLPTIPEGFPLNESGRYIGCRNWYPYVSTTPTGLGVEVLKAHPIYLSEGFTSDRLSINIQTGGAVGATARLGIYGTGTNNLPDNLLIDAGTVVTTSTGEKEITISQALPAGVIWLVVAGQGSPTNNGSADGLLWVTATGAYTSLKFDSSFANYRSRQTYFQRTATVAGALPATFGAGSWQVGAVLDLAIRRV